MAFMSSPSSTAGGDFLPILAYKANQGRLYTVDRAQNGAGVWETTETEVTMAQPAFAVDFGRLEVGWVLFTRGAAPQWHMAPYGSPTPAQPPSPGNDDGGKAIQFRMGFRVPVAGNAIGGIREFAGNSGRMIDGMNELHTAFEASPEASLGKIPVVKMVKAVPVKIGQSTNFQPVFEIITWVERPDALGPRTVPTPRAVTPSGSAPISEMTPQATAQMARASVAPAAAPKREMADAMPF
jgi:hypothetical protein